MSQLSIQTAGPTVPQPPVTLASGGPRGGFAALVAALARPGGAPIGMSDGNPLPADRQDAADPAMPAMPSPVPVILLPPETEPNVPAPTADDPAAPTDEAADPPAPVICGWKPMKLFPGVAVPTVPLAVKNVGQPEAPKPIVVKPGKVPLPTDGSAETDPTLVVAAVAEDAAPVATDAKASDEAPADPSVPPPVAMPQPVVVANSAVPVTPPVAVAIGPVVGDTAPVAGPVDAAPDKAPKPGQPAVSVDQGQGAQANPARVPAPVPTPVAPALIVPPHNDAAAAQALAALFTSAGADRAETERVSDAFAQALTGIRASASGAVSPATRVEPPAAALQTMALDTGRAEWIEALVDRIDEQRAQGSRIAHLKLSPDALGGVDVRIRHDGDRIHVVFATETAQARSLLADAAPRLAELADARGLKLGDTGVQQHNQHAGGRQRAHQSQPDAPVPVSVAAEADDAALSGRIA